MKSDEIRKTSNKIIGYLDGGRIKDAINLLLEFASQSFNNEFIIKAEEFDDIYRKNLEFSIKGFEDPERSRIINNLIVGIIELSDRCREFMLEKNSQNNLYQIKKGYLKSGISISEAVEDYLFKLNLSVNITMDEIGLDSIMEKMFKHIIFADKLSNSDIDALNAILKNKEVDFKVKCLIVSALTLSNIRFFDKNKVIFFINIYASDDQMISQRALFSLLFVFYSYEFRIKLFDDLNLKVTELLSDKRFIDDLGIAMLIVLKTVDSKKATDKLKNEIMPEMYKIAPKLRDKLNLDEFNNNMEVDETNPEWLNDIGPDSVLYDKIEELTSMQNEGFDIFIDAFANLKNFTFFDSISNWFLPFYSDNSSVIPENDDSLKKLAKIIGKLPFMCNSDRYSFLLNLPALPDQQKDLIYRTLEAQADDLDEEKKFLFNKESNINIIQQYVQDCYRFFKLSDYGKLFPDIFKLRLDFYKKEIFENYFNQDKLFLFSKYYFETEHYAEALEIYLILLKNYYDEISIFEKVAFCYEKLDKIPQAIEYYEKSIISDHDRLWPLMKLANCYKNENKKYDALRIYLEAINIFPDNTILLYSLSYLYIDLENYEKALQHLYKIEYLEPDNKKVIRSIAWSNFVIGKFDIAISYFDKIVDSYNRFDYLNIGHIYLCKSELEKANENYLMSLSFFNENKNEFFRLFEEDIKYLLDNGIEKEKINMITDYLKYEQGGI